MKYRVELHMTYAFPLLVYITNITDFKENVKGFL
jgi:hypothetical protein